MIVRKEEAWVFDTDERTAARRFVERAEVISLATLAQYVGCEAEQIERLLGADVAQARVEWLRPIAPTPPSDAVFCRWRNPVDSQYVWEQTCFEGKRKAGRSGRRADNDINEENLQ